MVRSRTKATEFSFSQDIIRILWNRKALYFHKTRGWYDTSYDQAGPYPFCTPLKHSDNQVHWMPVRLKLYILSTQHIDGVYVVA